MGESEGVTPLFLAFSSIYLSAVGVRKFCVSFCLLQIQSVAVQRRCNLVIGRSGRVYRFEAAMMLFLYQVKRRLYRACFLFLLFSVEGLRSMYHFIFWIVWADGLEYVLYFRFEVDSEGRQGKGNVKKRTGQWEMNILRIDTQTWLTGEM